MSTLGGRVFGLAVVTLAVAAVPARATTNVFAYTGAEQTFVVPADVHTIHVAAQGADGGSGSPLPSRAWGALIYADVSVTPGETLYVEVGGLGAPSNLCCSPSFNGGGAGGRDTFGSNNGGGGGGASDIRRLPRTAPGSESSRLVVAAGGGGGGGGGPYAHVPEGGYAGLPGLSCPECGGAGGAADVAAGGSGGDPLGVDASAGGDGQLGSGGDGGDGTAGGGGGGGGGYYGGGGGGGGDTISADGGGGGGGGGSSFAVGSYQVGGRFSTPPAPGHVSAIAITYEADAPNAEVTPSTVAFGRQPLESTTERVVTIKNTGSAALRVVSAKILSSRSPNFKLGAGCSAPVPVGASCQLPVRFTPRRTGTQRVHVQIQTNARTRYASLLLTGTGVHAHRKLSALRISPSTFAPARRGTSVARHGRVTVAYRADTAGTTTFRVLRVKSGVRSGKQCVKPSGRQRAGAKRCTRLVPVGASFSHADHRGTNRFHFTGRVREAGKVRRLTPGSYRLRASLRSAVATGRSVSAAFRIH